MSKIYQNTLLSIALGFAAKSISDGKFANSAKLGKAPLLFLTGVNLVDLLYNRGYSEDSAFQTNKVFYSATTQWLPACNVTKRELNYVDLAAKGLSIGLGVLSCLPKGEFISKNSMIFSLLPATLALAAEKTLDFAEVEYGYDRTWIQDCFGHYTYLEE